jgi:vacuolar iron transporter family protein
VPLVPFLVHIFASYVLIATTTLTALALFVGGMVISLFTGRDAFRGAIRMVLIGGGAGTVTFLLGKLLGGAIGP